MPSLLSLYSLSTMQVNKACLSLILGYSTKKLDIALTWEQLNFELFLSYGQTQTHNL